MGVETACFDLKQGQDLWKRAVHPTPPPRIPKINLLFYGAVQETVSKIFF